MRKRSAIVLGKSVLKLNKVARKGGTALPGLVASKISPQLLRSFFKTNFKDGVVVVTGTNGKTTTANLIADIFDKAGIKYIHNSAGSNLERGILSTMLGKSSLAGKINADVALLEVDEATIEPILRVCDPKLIVLTNLFRDQLDRYGEVSSLALRLQKSISEVSSKVLLNADDPMVVSIADGLPPKRVKYFGINDYPGRVLAYDRAFDMTTSPYSDSPLIYEQRYLGHIGRYRSKNNDFKRPDVDYAVEKITTNNEDKSNFRIKYGKKLTEYNLSIGGLYNIYNAIAAIALGLELGIKNSYIDSALSSTSASFGRVETIIYHDRQLQFLLIKNPTGFNQVIQSFLHPERTEPVLILINDNFADGRDVSWLWDVAIEDLNKYRGRFATGGIRAYDMALRLKYADIDPVAIKQDIPQAIEWITKSTKPGQKIYILPTYTAMLQARKYLVKKANITEFWQ